MEPPAKQSAHYQEKRGTTTEEWGLEIKTLGQLSPVKGIRTPLRDAQSFSFTELGHS